MLIFSLYPSKQFLCIILLVLISLSSFAQFDSSYLRYNDKFIADSVETLSDGKKIADTKSSIVLTDKKVIKGANLKETSLYNLAQLVGIENETDFVQSFIDYERQVRRINEN